ncbi:DUF397 domain-containing protein [Streptomyces sp. Rer75]|uniref:DUF397 domain-containing protein n=1 Tax=Streptomyces sp. Rer75 TaxID=2750011 RepID=UPI0015D03248|nr:DUF397 domain-containing protein [Streptomyces sp. Rer75]QLH24932.1 DUF397 domain-containing protein [Streptomyces sp. Rer75]
MSRLMWFKSSYSDSSGGDCVEVALDWHKSSYSDNTGGQCVEIARTPATVHVRDSKVTDGPNLHIPADAWSSFLTTLTRSR